MQGYRARGSRALTGPIEAVLIGKSSWSTVCFKFRFLLFFAELRYVWLSIHCNCLI